MLITSKLQLKNKIEKFIIAFILVIFFLLAVQQLVPFYSADELFIANWIWDMHHDPFPVNQYPPLFLYLHFILSIIYKVLFLLVGQIKNSYEFLYSSFGINFMIDAGRVVSAIFGTVLVFAVYKIGIEFYNRKVAIFSSMLLAFNNLMILHSHIFKSDVLSSLLLTISLFFLLKYLKGSFIKDLYLTSLFFGLSFTAKYNVVVFAVIILIVLLKKKSFFKNFLYFFLGAASGFIIGAPNWIIKPVANISLFLKKYNFDSGDVYIQDLTKIEIYSKFISDIVKLFTPLLTVVFIIGIITAIVKRNEKDILITLFIVFYILFFGLTGFYGDRFLLTLLPAISLIVGKTIFIDLINIKVLKRYNKKVFIFVLLIPGMIFFYSRIYNNIETFNLLKNTPKKELIAKYRKNHNIDNGKHVVATQIMSYFIPGDIKVKENLEIVNYPKLRKRKSKIQFFQSNSSFFKRWKNLNQDQDNERVVNLGNFKQFKIIKRPMLQTWDYDALLFYRFPRELGSKNLRLRHTNLPKMFYNSENNISYPTGVYDKDPGFGESEKGVYFKRIYSTKPILEFEILLFMPTQKKDMEIKINNKKVESKSGNFEGFIKKTVINNVKELPLNIDYQYVLEIEPLKKNFIKHRNFQFYVVINPKYYEKSEPVISFKLKSDISSELPEIYSGGKIPGWVKEFYRRTAVYLSLYKLLIKNEINIDTNQSNIFKTAFIPLEKGRYKIDLSTKEINTFNLRENDPVMNIHVYTPGEKRIKEYTFQDILNNNSIIDLEIKDNLVFITFVLNNLDQAAGLIKKITILPDLVSYINKNYR